MPPAEMSNSWLLNRITIDLVGSLVVSSFLLGGVYIALRTADANAVAWLGRIEQKLSDLGGDYDGLNTTVTTLAPALAALPAAAAEQNGLKKTVGKIEVDVAVIKSDVGHFKDAVETQGREFREALEQQRIESAEQRQDIREILRILRPTNGNGNH